MPLYFIDFKTVRLKDSFTQCSNICRFLEQFEQLILNKEKIKNIAKEKEVLEQKCQNDIFKEIAGIAGDKIKYKYKELRLLMELIEAREVAKINMEQLEKEKMMNNVES